MPNHNVTRRGLGILAAVAVGVVFVLCGPAVSAADGSGGHSGQAESPKAHRETAVGKRTPESPRSAAPEDAASPKTVSAKPSAAQDVAQTQMGALRQVLQEIEAQMELRKSENAHLREGVDDFREVLQDVAREHEVLQQQVNDLAQALAERPPAGSAGAVEAPSVGPEAAAIPACSGVELVRYWPLAALLGGGITMFVVRFVVPRLVRKNQVVHVEAGDLKGGQVNAEPPDSTKEAHLRAAVATAVLQPGASGESQEDILLELLHNPEIVRLPCRPNALSPVWGAAIGSVKGNVREKNEDAGLGWHQAGRTVIVLADGMGGMSHGADASRTACFAAAASLMRQLGCRGPESTDHPVDLAVAFQVACAALAERAVQLGLQPRDGLRTTLIAVVSGSHEYHWGYIGDGALKVLRADGVVDELLVPHKASADCPNVLSCSFGPTADGAPVFGRTPRREGDLLLGGTDGVFDRVPDTFVRDVLAGAVRLSGNLNAVVAQVLHDLAEARDEHGYLCDDNMSMAIVATGRPGPAKSELPANAAEEQALAPGTTSDKEDKQCLAHTT